MSIKCINEDPEKLKRFIEARKKDQEEYRKKNPDSLLPLFENELKELGFEFEISSQVKGFLPKHKKTIVPIAIRYYQLAKEKRKSNEQNYFLGLLHVRGNDEVIPMLLADYYSAETENLTRWFISDCIYTIRSKKFIKEYLEIVTNTSFGTNRKMIILLLGSLKEETAIPTLINLLEDEDVRLQAIVALGNFKREEFRCHFERFQDSKHYGWRKYSRKALAKLNK